MADYYLYLLDHSSHVSKRVELMACRDDDHARDVAAAYPHPAAMELWQGNRQVETYAARKAYGEASSDQNGRREQAPAGNRDRRAADHSS